jgi:hypothetical protein
MNVNLHIERLILDGLPVSSLQGAAVRSALERELARVLAQGGLVGQLGGGGAVPHVPPQQFNLAPGERPDAIGRHIARSLHRGIGGDAK